MLKLRRYLRPELALDAPEVSTQQELFEYVADRLVERGVIADREVLVGELLRREAQGSTGVGHGVALPHAALDSVREVVVVLVRLTTTLAWQAIDNEPVRLVVLILGPAADRSTYLKVLAETARSLNQPGVTSAALRARTPGQAAEAVADPPHEGFLIRNRRLLVFSGLVAAIFFLSRWLLPKVVLPATGFYSAPEYARFSEPLWLFRQELTVTLFFAMILGTLLFWRYRVAIAAASLGLLLVAGVMDLETTVKFMSIPTILFIMAMMVIVRWLQNIGVFRYLVARALESVRGAPWRLLLILMVFSVVLGGFADEVSAILVTFGLAQEVSRRTNTPLVPYLMCLVFATNVGSALTLIGNPIGAYIAFAGKLSFEDFLRWATPVSLVAAAIICGLCLLLYRRHFFRRVPAADLHGIDASAGTIDMSRLRTGLVTFAVVILLIAVHRRVEVLLGLGEGTALVAEALVVVGFIVFYEQEKGRLLVERGIDWWTLLFFMFLFANAACLEYTGVTTKLGYLMHSSATRLTFGAGPASATGAAMMLMLWFSGIASGFADNLPVVAALAPIARDMGRIGMPHASILWWALLFGGCFGGNLTVVGSIANHVAVGTYERISGKSIRFRDWLGPGIIVTLVALVVASIGLLIQLRSAP